MACNARRRSSCLRSKGYDGMPRRTSFDHVCSSKAVMACHARRHSTVCALQRLLFHVMPDVVRPCFPSKGYDGMPRPMSFVRVFCLKAMMACHARRSLTMCAYQGRLCHATPNVFISCVLSMGGSVMPRLTLPTVCAVQGR